jgi:glycosyltransferase involved in cell wall biosynthesis
MLKNKKIVVVMPAYNAEKTLKKTYSDIPHDIVDEVILVDDKSLDQTVKIAEELNLSVFKHNKNLGYGANQKTCYQNALKKGADIVVMLHPDYQYNPKLIRAMCSLIAEDIYDAVLASRILGGKCIKSGMPIYKYFFNRCLTFIENLIIGQKISEYHTGYRAFSKEVLKNIPLLENSNDFVFDNQMLLQVLYFNFKVGEISCPTKYEGDSSSINFQRSLKYGTEVLLTAAKYFLARKLKMKIRIFDENGKKLN